MTHLIDRWVVPGLWFLGDWSLRWGLLLAVLAIWLTLRPPRRAATRHLLCLAAMAAGVLLPVVPRWGGITVPWPSPATRSATEPAARALPPPPARLPESAATSVFVAKAESVAPVRLANRPRQVPPAAAPLGWWRIATLAAALAWAMVVLVLLARLAGGRLMLGALRREAVAVGEGPDRLLDECRSSLRMSRPVGIAAHPAVATPVVAGGLRPVVLVPPDWVDWPEPDRRACLLHELAHLARYDDWAKLVQEMVRVPLFFHPLVYWLLARLDRERELLCDEAVVALGSDPLTFARLLLDLARRPGRLLPVTTSHRPGWLPFLDRRTVAVRIERLLEDDMPRTLSRPSVVRSFLLVTLAMAVALVVGGLRVRAVSGERTDPPKPTQQSKPAERPSAIAKPAAPAGARETPREFQGVVVDPEGHPVPGATIVAGSYDPGRSGHQTITTDDVGRFTWPIPPGAERVCLIAHKDGFAVGGISAPASAFVDPHDLKLRLGKSAPFVATLVDGEGKPVVGAQIRVEMTAHSSEQKNGPRTSMISTGFVHIRREVIGGSPLEHLFLTKTDASGSFAFRALGADAGLKLAVTAADGRMLLVKPASQAVGLIRRTLQDQGFVTAPPGETTRLVAVPTARVAGRVFSKLPGVVVSGLTAYYQQSHSPGSPRRTANFGEEVRTDAEGRFAFEGLAEGTINVVVSGDGENKDWTYRAAKDVPLTSGATSEVTLELIRGVQVEGTIVAQGTGLPVEGAQVGVYGPFRPRTSAMTTGAKTDAQGRYHYRLPSGETYFYVMGPPGGFTTLSGEGSSRTVTIPDRALRYEVPPIELAAAVTVRGRVLDAKGSPIAGATVVGTCEGGLCRPFGGTDTVTDTRGEFRLPPGLNNTVAIGKPARLLIRLRDGAEHEAAAVPAADGAVTIKLPVSGEATGRVEGPREVAPDELAGVVVDTDGKPIEGAEVERLDVVPRQRGQDRRQGFFPHRRARKGPQG